MDKLKYVKIENEDGSLSDNIPLGVDAENVDVTSAGGSQNLADYISVNDGKINSINSQIDDLQDSDTSLSNQIKSLSIDIENSSNPIAKRDVAILGEELITSEGWISIGWSGNYNNGFTHIIGESSALEYPLLNTGTKKFQVAFDVESPTPTGAPNASTAFSVVIGNSTPMVTYDGGGSKHYEFGIQSVENGNLKFILTAPADPSQEGTTFDGTIKNISVKEIISNYDSIRKFYDTFNQKTLEIRVNPYSQNNIYVGNNSGQYNTTGKGNTGVGSSSLSNNTSGYWNTAIGYRCMEDNTTGSRNVGIGYLALNDNTSGDRNYAIGTFALTRNTNGRCNVAIGADTLWNITSGSNNVAIGSASQSEMTTNSYNTSIGQGSLSNAKSGNNQIAIGYLALGTGDGGDYNIAIGRQALYKTSTENNVGIGYAALNNNTTGTQNVAVGNSALSIAEINNYCTAIGYSAGQLGSGNGNTLIGCRAGLNNVGNNNVFIGFNSNQNGTSNYNSICIGNGSSLPSKTAGYLLSLGNVIYGDLSKGLICINKDKKNLAFNAVLEIGTSTNGAPPLKFTNQELVEAPVPGAFEYYNNKLYFTLGNGTRKEIQLNTIE